MPLLYSDAKEIMQTFAERYHVDIPSITDERTATSAYRMLALKIHPDKNKIAKNKTEAEEDFKKLGEAYTSLMNSSLNNPENPGESDKSSPFFTTMPQDFSDFWQDVKRGNPASSAAAFEKAKNLNAGSFAFIRHTRLGGEEAISSKLAQHLQAPVREMIAELKIYLYLEREYSKIVREKGQSDSELSDFNIAFTIPSGKDETTGVHIRFDISSSGGIFSPDTQFAQELLEKLKACHFVLNTKEMGRRAFTETMTGNGKHYNCVLLSNLLNIDLVNEISKKVSQLIMQVTEGLDMALTQTQAIKGRTL